MTLALFVLAIASPPQQEAPRPMLFDGTGAHRRKVITESTEAQLWFDQGLAFMFAFNHDEAVRSFEEAARIDPGCAMAYWGIANSLGPNINNPAVEPEAATKAWGALRSAKKALGVRMSVERDLIEAQIARYSQSPTAERGPLDKAYADAMREVWRKHPKDADVGALTAEALMDLHPWDLWTHDGKPKPWTPEIKTMLEGVLKVSPKHPLALHLYVHTTEASANPEHGLTAARTLQDLNPGLGHMVHMPSHTYVRTGNWNEAIESNRKAILADEAYFAMRPEQGFYLIYMTHNHQMRAFAAMMVGRSEEGVKGFDDMMQSMPKDLLEDLAPLVDGYLAAVYEARVRFGKWDDILAMPEPSEKFPVMRSMRHMARSVSWAVKGDQRRARMEQSLFYDSRAEVPKEYAIGNNSASAILAIAVHLMNGEILLGEGKMGACVAELERAVRAEDASKYNEPPDWLQPTRHALGAVLVKMGRFEEAEKVYREDLRRLPNNGWSTFGLAQALRAQGRDATDLEAKFKTVWSQADIAIESSCLCVR